MKKEQIFDFLRQNKNEPIDVFLGDESESKMTLYIGFLDKVSIAFSINKVELILGDHYIGYIEMIHFLDNINAPLLLTDNDIPDWKVGTRVNIFLSKIDGVSVGHIAI